MNAWYEVAFDRLYPVLYRHRDEAEARRAARTFAPQLDTSGGVVLDLACGAGRHMLAFAAEGLRMVGMDLSSFLLERAAGAESLRGRLVRGDMRVLPLRDGALGGVINMFTSFGYFESDDENRRVLAEIARVLRPGGRFLMDFLNAGRIDDTALTRTVREVDGYTIDEDRSRSGDARYLVKQVRITRRGDEPIEYVERVRLFSPEEIDGMLGAAGLSMVGRYGDYGGCAFDPQRHDRLISLYENGGGR